MNNIGALALEDIAKADLPPKDRIVRAARELFYRSGLHSVGVDAIAEAAGTNKMTLYRHFDSKDLLIAECMRQICSDFLAAWQEIAPTCEGDPKRLLKAWLDFSFDRTSHSRGCALANAAVQLPDKDHPAKRVIEDNKRKFREMTVQLVRDAGLDEPELVADELFLLCEGANISIESVGAEGPASQVPRLIDNMIARHTPRLSV
ncbi:MAG: yjdC 1 [Rhodospirillales bacterium]|nr:yjdC 1 [Rhodospirillales bacterium]